MEKRIRIGMIGCGGNATGHLKRLLGIPEVEVAGLMDVSQDSLSRMVERVPEAQESLGRVDL